MTDAYSVVSRLKLTPKGKLQYGKGFDEEYLCEAVSKLCISPHISKNILKVNNKDFNKTQEKVSDCYSNYFTTKREENTHIGSPRKEVPPPTEKPIVNQIADDNSVNNYKTLCDETLMDIRNINVQYHDQSKDLRTRRLHEYYMKVQGFDLEHVKSIEAIERSFIIKKNEELKQLDEDQNRTSEELAYYQAVKEEREYVASEKLRQAELHRREIEMKIKRDNEIKEQKKEKKRTLASLAEPGLKVLNTVIQLFVQKSKQHNCDELKSVVDEVNQVHAEFTNIVNQGINTNLIDELDSKIRAAREKLNNLSALQKQCEGIVKQLEQKTKDEEEKKGKEKVEKRKEDEEKPSVSPSVPLETKPVIPPLVENELNIAASAPALAPIESMLRPMLQMFIPKSVFREYLRLSKLVSDTEKLHEGLSKSKIKEKKDYKFDLYKVVNTTINAISDESPRHLMDKITRLTTLLSGKEVVNAGKRVSTKLDPQAMILSKDLIAKKLVLQGPTQVASSYKAAFAISAVILGIWSQFPDVGELLMAHLYVKCPYTVPFYIPKSKEISTVDYCKLIGYSVDGTEVESEDKYLKKLSGLIRLYAAIISSDIPPSLANRNHPHGLDHGWMWLTRVLNLEPRPVTATIIYDFLEVAGHAMMKRYGRQFRKLLLVLYEEVMPKILEVTPKESKAGAMRLQIFLDSCVKEGRVKQPDGYLTKHWYSSQYYR